MANEFRTLDSHSAEYFGDTRDHWWNLDFLELIGKRLSLGQVHDALDIGCGVGHWGQLLASILPSEARLRGVDRDPLWIEKATARAAARGLGHRCTYEVSAAEMLPFADASFDLVTCQTLLIHTRDPALVIAEMARVARPGGLVLAAEPNNIANALVFDSLSFHDPVESIMARLRLQIVCERGKAALGEGHNSIGDLVPGLFSQNGLEDIRVYLNDKANAFVPPYDTPEQRAMLEERADFEQRDFWIWSREDTHRYFLAGGGGEAELAALWTQVMDGEGDKLAEAIAERSYSAAGGGIGYLIAGRKPLSEAK